MTEISRIGLDTSKNVFVPHWVDARERPALCRKLRRAEVEGFFARLPPTLVGLEACGASHHWARVLQSLGHQVRLLPPQYVKPYLKRARTTRGTRRRWRGRRCASCRSRAWTARRP